MFKIEGGFIKTNPDKKVSPLRSKTSHPFQWSAIRGSGEQRRYCKKCPLSNDCEPRGRASKLTIEKKLGWYLEVDGKQSGSEGCGLVPLQK